MSEFPPLSQFADLIESPRAPGLDSPKPPGGPAAAAIAQLGQRLAAVRRRSGALISPL